MSVGLDDEDMEEGRRARMSRRERESFGSLRFSERFGDLVEMGLDGADEDDSLSDLAAAATTIMDDMVSDESILHPDENETTRNLRALMEADDGLQGRMSGDLGVRQSLGTDGDPTFEFRIPERSRFSSVHAEDAADDAPAEDNMEVEGDLDQGPGAEMEDQYSQASEDDDQLLIDQAEIIPEDAASPEQSIHQSFRRTEAQEKAARLPREQIQKTLHRSKFGTEYPSLPPAVVKKLASTYSRSCGGNGRLNKETVLALSQASDWFFEQISDDLATYSTHARRKTIEEADVITLMKR
jgi:histone H3/H4